MSNNLFKKLIDKTDRLYKESLQKNNNKFSEKIINFSQSCKGNSESVFEFKSGGKRVEILIKFDSENAFNFDVVFNDVLIGKFENRNNGEMSFLLYCKEENFLKIYTYAESENLSNFHIFIIGDLEKQSKTISKLLFLNNKYYFNKNNLLTISNDIMTKTIYINNNIYDNNDNVLDINYGYINSSMIKNEILQIYYDVSLKLKNIDSDIVYNLGIDVDDSCVLSHNHTDKIFNVFYVKNGVVKVNNYSEDMTLTSSKKLGYFDGRRIVNISSIISDEIVENFIVKSADEMWYLVGYNFEKNDIKNIIPIDVCDDLKVYGAIDNIICLEKNERGIVVKKYKDYSFSEKLFEKEFLNVDDAYYYDGKMYLSNCDNVQVVEI